MSENYHMERAKSRLHNGTNNEVARAQAEAVLALAHEQREANRIAEATALIGLLGQVAGSAYRERLHEKINKLLMPS